MMASHSSFDDGIPWFLELVNLDSETDENAFWKIEMADGPDVVR